MSLSSASLNGIDKPYGWLLGDLEAFEKKDTIGFSNALTAPCCDFEGEVIAPIQLFLITFQEKQRTILEFFNKAHPKLLSAAFKDSTMPQKFPLVHYIALNAEGSLVKYLSDDLVKLFKTQLSSFSRYFKDYPEDSCARDFLNYDATLTSSLPSVEPVEHYLNEDYFSPSSPEVSQTSPEAYDLSPPPQGLASVSPQASMEPLQASQRGFAPQFNQNTPRPSPSEETLVAYNLSLQPQSSQSPASENLHPMTQAYASVDSQGYMGDFSGDSVDDGSYFQPQETQMSHAYYPNVHAQRFPEVLPSSGSSSNYFQNPLLNSQPPMTMPYYPSQFPVPISTHAQRCSSVEMTYCAPSLSPSVPMVIPTNLRSPLAAQLLPQRPHPYALQPPMPMQPQLYPSQTAVLPNTYSHSSWPPTDSFKEMGDFSPFQ